MAFASVGSLGSVGSNTADQSSLVLTTTATLEAGHFAFIAIAVDNNQTTDGDEGAVTGVVDSAGNTWSKAAEFTNGQGAAQAGATVSLWYVVAATQLSSGGTITVSFNNSTSRDASGCHAWEFTIGAGSTVQIEGTPATQANDAADAASLNVTTSNIECLRVRAIATEGQVTGSATLISANTANWTNIPRDGTSGVSAGAQMTIGGEFRISTGTGDASDPTFSATSADRANVYVAFKEVTPVNLSPGQGNLTLSTTAPSMVIDVRRDPGQADLALSTTAPTIVVDVRRDPASADLALSTTAPTVGWTDHHFATPASTDLALSTTAPTVAWTDHHFLTPASADLALSTTEPTVDVSDAQALVPASGQLSLSRTAPSVVIDVRRDPASANLALSTTAPTLIVDVRRDPAQGNLVLSTTAPRVSIGFSLTPVAGELALSTTAPIVDLTTFAQPIQAGGGDDRRRKLKKKRKKQRFADDEDEAPQPIAGTPAPAVSEPPPPPLNVLPPLAVRRIPELPDQESLRAEQDIRDIAALVSLWLESERANA